MSSRSRVNWVFGILSVYIIVQFLWWSYLLLNLTSDYYHLKEELHIAWGVEGESDIVTELANKRYMIIGEGLIFLLILIAGMVLTVRYMQRDARLARLQRNFLLSVTHELKTPIASAQLYLQTLQKRKLEAAQQSDLLSKAIDSNKRLEQLVEKLLLATQLENAGFSLEMDEVEVVPLIKRSAETIASLDKDRHRYSVLSETSPVIRGDAFAIETILLNLLENAAKYAPVDTEIAIELDSSPDTVRIDVSNSGSISARDQKRVFEKFFRAGNEETRSAKGTGVGLYLVRKLVELHGGSIELQSASNTVTFSITLPKLK